MAKAALKALQQFTVAGREYAPGHVFPLEHTHEWPEGSLERRLNNRFVEFAAAEEEPKKPKQVRGEVVLKSAE